MSSRIIIGWALLVVWMGCVSGCHSPDRNRAGVNRTQPDTGTDILHIYVLMGQSNMAGRDRTRLAEQTPDPRILMLNPQGQWVIAQDPLHPKRGRIEPGEGPGMEFARQMLRTETDPRVKIGLIPCAVGGSSLQRWTQKGDLYVQMLERVRQGARSGVLKGVLWHQGETDAARDRESQTYEQRLKKMIGDLRTDLNQPDLPIVVGQLGEFLGPPDHPHVDRIRQAIRRVAHDLPRVGYADSAGLTDLGDNLHFDSLSARELGKRFAESMRSFNPPGVRDLSWRK